MSGYDLAVIGSGPGGYVAAIRAAQLGMKVAVVEKAELGGVCTNWGCIPTKALLRSAEVVELIAHASDLGIKIEGSAQPDFEKMIGRSRQIAEKQQKGIEFLFKKNKIETLRGTGKLVRQNGRIGLTVDGKPIEAKNILLATGARPKPLPGIEHDGSAIISYREAMTLKKQPAKIVIIGAGAIGIEFAYFYHAVGTQVTVLEAMGHVLPVEDEEVSTTLKRSLQKLGIEILTGAKVERVEKSPVRVHAIDDKGQKRAFEGDVCLLAAGVRGNVEGLGLQECGIKTERGFIVCDLKSYRTSAPNVYAIGDVIGPPMLAHKASAEGIACVEAIAGAEVHAVDYAAIPGCTFCRPEVASVGLTEAKAKAAGLKFKVGRFPFSASGKARAAAETEGFVKVLVGEEHGELLGAHLLGGTSTDLIATLTLAMTAELTSDEILSTVFSHPTFSEALKEAVADAHGEAIDL
ncbi:MAG TPA: dihydrolipoyl dehydrogenase [Polyangia bacterium]